MRASRSYQAQYLRMTVAIDAAKPGTHRDAAVNAGNHFEADRWTGVYLADENNDMNFADGHDGRAPKTPADWKLMIQNLNGILDGYGFEIRRGSLVENDRARRAAAEEAKTSEPVITIDITDTGSALGYVRGLPEDEDWSIFGNKDVFTGHWAVWSDAHGSATGSSLEVALKRWARDLYGIAHGRATGENELTNRKIDVSW